MTREALEMDGEVEDVLQLNVCDMLALVEARERAALLGATDEAEDEESGDESSAASSAAEDDDKSAEDPDTARSPLTSLLSDEEQRVLSAADERSLLARLPLLYSVVGLDNVSEDSAQQAMAHQFLEGAASADDFHLRRALLYHPIAHEFFVVYFYGSEREADVDSSEDEDENETRHKRKRIPPKKVGQTESDASAGSSITAARLAWGSGRAAAAGSGPAAVPRKPPRVFQPTVFEFHGGCVFRRDELRVFALLYPKRAPEELEWREREDTAPAATIAAPSTAGDNAAADAAAATAFSLLVGAASASVVAPAAAPASPVPMRAEWVRYPHDAAELKTQPESDRSVLRDIWRLWRSIEQREYAPHTPAVARYWQWRALHSSAHHSAPHSVTVESHLSELEERTARALEAERTRRAALLPLSEAALLAELESCFNAVLRDVLSGVEMGSFERFAEILQRTGTEMA
jgi:hypothetical protein